MTIRQAILSLTLLAGFVSQSLGQSSSAYELQLQAGPRQLSENLAELIRQPPFRREELLAGKYYRYLQFYQLPDSQHIQQLKALGVELLDYLPKNIFVAALPSDLNIALLANFSVRGLHPILPIEKIAIGLREDLAAASENQQMHLLVGLQKNLQAALVRFLLQQKQIEIISPAEASLIEIIVVRHKVEALAAHPMIRYLEAAPLPAQAEDRSGRSLHRSNLLHTAYRNGRKYDGSGVHLAIGDDGFIGPHIDFAGRTEQEAVAGDMEGEHGEVVAGILGGAGNLDERNTGMAPGAYLHVLNGFDAVKTERLEALNAQVVITSTSYGDGCNRGYTLFTQLADQQIRENPHLIHVFSAGNAGLDDCGYGAGPGWGNITGGIKTGKNVLAVANLYSSDERVENSSRGPTSDGRIKPDISANGNGQLSTAPNNAYVESTGSSAAAPGVAGVLAQLYQAYRQLNDGQEPASALMKACLLNTAEDLGNEGPDYSFGWGRIHAFRALQLLEENRFEQASIGQFGRNQHRIEVPDKPIKELRIMLYWHDVEGSPASQTALVNDLDLEVADPDGQTHLPWLLNHSPQLDKLAAPAKRGRDHLNNVEQVSVTDPPPGEYTIWISGGSIPIGPQQYFVVYEWLADDISLSWPHGGERLAPGETVRLFWDAPKADGHFQIEFSDTDAGNWQSIGSATADKRYFDWLVPERQSAACHIRISRNSQSAINQPAFSIFKPPSNLHIVRVCPEYTQLSWEPVDGATSYTLYQLGSRYMDSIMTVTATTAEVPIANPKVQHWFAVSANGSQGERSRRSLAVSDGSSLEQCQPQQDVSIWNVQFPAEYSLPACFSIKIPVSINILNSGSDLISGFPLHYQLDDGDVITEHYGGSIPSAITVNYVFAQSIALDEPGIHQLKVWTGLASDQAAFNDTIELPIKIVEAEIRGAPYFENFETFDLCVQDECRAPCALSGGWINLVGEDGDQIDWQAYKGATPSYGTGPSVDQNTGGAAGKYLYLEGSRACHNKSAHLLSPCLDLSGIAHPVFTFWYHMNGAHMGNLLVDLYDGYQWHYHITAPISGDQGQGWKTTAIDLSAFTSKTVNIRFSGETGPNYLTDIAIDNIALFDAKAPPISAFTVSRHTSCKYVPIQFLDNSFNTPTSWHWQFEPDQVVFQDGTNANSPNPVVQLTGAGEYLVQLTTSNAYGSHQLVSIPGYIQISDGQTLPVSESFEEMPGLLPEDWQIQNPDESIGWRSVRVIGKSGLPSSAMYVNNHSYSDRGQRDDLLSPLIDLSQAVHPQLRFDLSYSLFNPAYSDELHIIISEDCGDSFTEQVYSKSGSQLATAEEINYSWLPGSSADWRTEVVDLSVFAGSSIRVKFVNVCDFGNNLFLDNILWYERDSFPEAGFSMQLDGEGFCAGTQILFSNTSQGGGSDMDYEWQFGEKAIPSEAIGIGPHEVLFPETGSYEVRLTVTHLLGSSTWQQTVTIAEPPEAAFVYSFDELDVFFDNQSEAATDYFWDFGDGHTSTAAFPSHQYSIPGNYTVSLSASNACGESVATAMLQISTSSKEPGVPGALLVSPNPASASANQLSLFWRQPAPVDAWLKLYQIDGQLIWQQSVQLSPGQAVRPDIGGLAQGVYLLHLEAAQLQETYKVFIY